MPRKGNSVLERMLERLFAALVSGPGLNCRPHASRQRIDLTQFAKLKDVSPDALLRKLLDSGRHARATANVPAPKRRKAGPPVRPGRDNGQNVEGAELTPEERDAVAAWEDQDQVFRKLRVIVEDARVYEQDTGVHVLSIGFPLLSLPPSSFKASGGSMTRRIVAPVAFIPVSVTVRQGAGRSVEIKCRGEGTDLVVPNTALLAWLQQQTGKDLSELYSDDAGEAPWREIRELAAAVARLAGVASPAFLDPAERPAGNEDAPADPISDEPAALQLTAAPMADDDTEAAILPAAVLGLFPMANQGLLRDTQEMIAEPALAGPVASFVRPDAILDAPHPPEPPADGERPEPVGGRDFSQDRLVASADPSQARAVRLARACQGLVIHGPPGTGKSQTITNIIGDHLSRGQRVLVVCDKRTALDVVIDRLDRLGLRNLCALVYDPQRDRRELYKAIRQRLDELPEAKTDSRAESELDRLDRELGKLHAELTAYASALARPDEQSGLSFHELVGQWLAASGGESSRFDGAEFSCVRLDAITTLEHDVRDILDRAAASGYAQNPWREAWGISPGDYLARGMDEIREKMSRCVGAAAKADEAAHPAIPPFAPGLPLNEQADARAGLAADLRTLLRQVDPAVLKMLAGQADEPVENIRRSRERVAEAEPWLKILRAAPLDAELVSSLNGQVPSAKEASNALRVVTEYAQTFRHWSGRYRYVSSRAPSAGASSVVQWLSRDAQSVRRAGQRLRDLAALASAVAAERLDRSLAMQYEQQPFGLVQTVRWLGLLNAYLESAGKWYAFLKPGPKKSAAPVAQLFGLALDRATGVRLRDFLTGLRRRLELKADLEDGILSRPLAALPNDDELLAAYAEHKAVVDAVSEDQTVDADPLAPELIHPLMPVQASPAAGVLAGYGLPLDLPSADRLAGFLSGLSARLRCVELLRELSSPLAPGLTGDAVLEKMLGDIGATLDFWERTLAAVALKCIHPQISQAMRDPAGAGESLVEGLEKSPARAAAVADLEQAVEHTGLFRPRWITDADERLRSGALEHATVLGLFESLDTLENVLRVAKGLDGLPDTIGRAVRLLVDESVAPDDGFTLLRRAALTGEIGDRLKADPTLHDVDRLRMQSGFEQYRGLEAQKRLAVQNVIRHLWITRQKARLLSNTGSRLNAAGAELRRRLTIQGEHAMRLRQVIALGSRTEGGDPLFDLCPVWMASPETVAQLFPREPIFDLVIFDEASQCRLEEAMPVLTRASRVVVAGDPQQLPPTRFFESAVAESTDEEIESDQQLFEIRQGEVEDLLAAALNLEIRQCYLNVHYRSRNSDLIEFSNEHFYGSRLQPIPAHPSNRARFAPITLYRAGGVYEKRTNEAEAGQVCRIVADLLKRSDPPSIGIACFNLPQRDLIVEKLEQMALEDPAFAKRLAAARGRVGAGSSEALFVKNLESVQGDERDHVVISTTYGPDAGGRFFRRFGPVGRAGGGRRLNVLVTRARQEVHLVTSIPAEAYRTLPPIPPGQGPSGAWLLFAYLAYAERLASLYESAREAPAPAPDEQPAKVRIRPTHSPSGFARALAEDLAGRKNVGSDVHWGGDGFCIDLALHHPQRDGDVTIGVLCDGSRFSRVEDPVEWDVFRTAVLELQGWKLHRLWTPHFFRDPEGGTRAIVDDVRAFLAQEDPQDGLRTVKG